MHVISLVSIYLKEIDRWESIILKPVDDMEVSEGGSMYIDYGGIGVGYITTPNGCLCRVYIIEKITLVGDWYTAQESGHHMEIFLQEKKD